MPAMLAVAGSEGINILRNTPSILTTLHENVRAIRAILDRVDAITIPSHPASATIHLYARIPAPTHLSSNAPPSLSSSGKLSNPLSIVPRDPPHFDYDLEEKLLQDVVEECLAQGVMVTRSKTLRKQELAEVRPSIRLAVTAALSRKDCEKAANVIKAACTKIIGKRR